MPLQKIIQQGCKYLINIKNINNFFWQDNSFFFNIKKKIESNLKPGGLLLLPLKLKSQSGCKLKKNKSIKTDLREVFLKEIHRINIKKITAKCFTLETSYLNRLRVKTKLEAESAKYYPYGRHCKWIIHGRSVIFWSKFVEKQCINFYCVWYFDKLRM